MFNEEANEEINDELNNIIEDMSLDNEILEEAINETSQTNDEESKNNTNDNMLQEKLIKKEEEAKQNLDKYMRTLAEYDNYRKRSQKEKSDMYDKGIMDTVIGFLDIVDNFDRALSGIKVDEEDTHTKSLYDGVSMIRKQFDKVLSDIGVKEIESVGCEFDPNLHNAVTHAEDENLGENIVSEEFQKGYIYNDKVIRYSMVKVVN